MNTFVYEIGKALYINLTNECTNRCDFCIRNSCSGVGGHELWLEREPQSGEILEAIDNPNGYEEIVFCGFGEPMIKIDELVEIASVLKEQGVRIRVNTNGQANLYHGYNVVPRLKGLVDTISISLNAPVGERYQEICQSEYGVDSFNAIIDFTRDCMDVVPEVVLTIVDVALSKEEVKACEEIAKGLGVEFRIRNYY